MSSSYAYYNEIDPDCADWLRGLIKRGLIAPGYVDQRSIEDVCPDELWEFTQCHFFAGVGVWSYALRKAGWADERPVWTGSCPCQPFSQAGQGLGFDDPRHLWPAWRHLIKESKPAIVLGEQTSGAAEWLLLVRGDLEAMGYAFAAMPIQAASAGAFHLRDRLWFVADASRPGLEERISEPRVLREMAGASEGEDFADVTGPRISWFYGPDGKRRPFEPSVPPVANGSTGRVVRIRAYGNAINVKAAQAFIECLM